MKKDRFRDRSTAATLLFLIVMVVLLLSTYLLISANIKSRSLGRMEEGVNTVITEIQAKLERDSRVLNATADIISADESFDEENVLEIIKRVSPLLDTMKMRVLLSNDLVITPDGSVTDASTIDNLSFEAESKLGEHISNRVDSIKNGTPVLRHFVPIVQNGETVAMLYGVTVLKDLPKVINIDNIYNASANVYMVDTRNGDFLLNTVTEELGSIYDYADGMETKGGLDWDGYTENLLDLQTGYVIYRPEKSGGWEYMYYAPAGINQWAIAVSVPEKEAFASVNQVRNICIILGVILAVAFVAYYMLVRYQAKQVTDQAVERAVLEEKLHRAEAAERAKTTFLSNMSHDIRTPMNAIIGFTTLAETNVDNPERVQEYLKKIMSSSNHLLSLINDVLDMSRIESGKLNIEEKECAISDIFRDMRNIIQSQMQAKQLNFFMDTVDVVDEDIWCDKLHLNQVLLNLLSNAIKFTPSGGAVSMTIRQKSGAPRGYGSYEIRVKDTGIGMSREFAQHIFEPFERERNSTVSGIQGTGLGMAITKSIVDAMGGTIELKTEQGKGTEFIIDLDFRLQSTSRKVEAIRELMGLRALVVDDSFSTCDSVTKMLTQIGMRAEWTLHGKEAVLRARQAVEMGDRFYAYIIDWALPDLSGLEVVRQVRVIVGDDAPIIIVTAYDWTAFEDEAKEAGVTAFCNKPIFLSELRDTLITALGKAEPVLPRQPPAGWDIAESLRGTRILLVEDNELNREIAQELLAERGFEVDTAEDGTEALAKVEASAPGDYSLILMDIQMPIMNGYDASKAIRALPDPKLANIPIVAMTANAFDDDRKAALEAGMNDHVAKPINVERLMDVIERLLKE